MHNYLFRKFKRTLLPLLFLHLSTLAVETPKLTCDRIEKLLYMVNKLHHEPPVFDKKFSEKVIQAYLFNLDPQCLHFYNDDINVLKTIQNNEPNPEEVFCKSYDFITGIYQKRLTQTDSLLTACLSKKYTWQKNDTLFIKQTYSDNYPKNKVQKTDNLEKWIKLYMLRELDFAGKLEKDFEFEQNNNLKIKTINKLKKNVSRIIHHPEDINSALEEDLLKSITLTCDPHSDYFTPKEKTNFTDLLSPTVEAYGFATGENENGHIEIVSVKPGSPAWKCNNLNKGDQITEIRFKNKSPIDVTDYDADEFYYMMGKATEKEMDISVLKKNGSVVKTHLAKAPIQSEENVINSYVLSKTKPIGYIPLPSFYTDFSAYTASGCTNDVAKEIAKLKAENIEGLILDLRNNGGGSLTEALNLAGIFIDVAPLCVQKIKSEKPIVLKDMNRGSIYDGPLIILINNISASASEILAQMLKDQERAIIVGSNSFGKATGQVIMPLDTSYSLTPAKKYYNEKNGFVKLTIEKFYGLSGTTHQNKGVEPHIHLPDLWYKSPIGEKEYDNALSNDVINKKVKLDVWPDAKIPICKDLSSKRINENNNFKRVVALADTFKLFYEGYSAFALTPLECKKRIDERSRFDSISEQTMSSEDSSFKVTANKHNAEIMKIDELIKEQITEQINSLKKDILLQESYNILMDYNSN